MDQQAQDIGQAHVCVVMSTTITTINNTAPMSWEKQATKEKARLETQALGLQVMPSGTDSAKPQPRVDLLCWLLCPHGNNIGSLCMLDRLAASNNVTTVQALARK